MNKLPKYAVFSIILLSLIILENGIHSNQVFAQENQTGIENEVELEADIKEPGNMCAKDSECKNVNQVNNG
ncbi:MAG: hypothetical protein DA328_06700 [Nitrososphaeraceae archaeon]|nr:hypothetical protein [Nitrososphaeraceae archaeon]